MKKKILAMFTVVMMLVFTMVTPVFATESDNGERDTTSQSESGDGENSDGSEQSVVLPTAEDYNIVTNDDLTVTFARADGSIMANVNVTVKNTTTGQEGDISRDEFATDENGVFDYSQWIDNDVAILRLTDSVLGGTLEYNIETGAINIEAGKSSGGGGDRGTATQSSVTMYIIAGAVVVVIAIVAVIIILKRKQAKKKFEEQAKKKTKKK